MFLRLPIKLEEDEKLIDAFDNVDSSKIVSYSHTREDDDGSLYVSVLLITGDRMNVYLTEKQMDLLLNQYSFIFHKQNLN